MNKEEDSLKWLRQARKKISKKLLSIPTNEERVKYIKNKVRDSKTNITTLKARKRKAS